MNIAVELVKGVALFLWPALILYILLTFKNELRSILESIPQLLGRMRSAELPGLKFSLDELSEQTLEAIPDVKSLANASPGPPPDATGIDIQASAEAVASLSRQLPSVLKIVDPTESVRFAIAESSLLGVTKAHATIVSQVKQLVATSGFWKDYVHPKQAIRLLVQKSQIPKSLGDALETFLGIVGDTSLNEIGSELLKRLASEGVHLVQLLSEVPRNFHQVVFANVPLFMDPDGKEQDSTAKGVMLRGIDQFNRPSGMIQIFPTTRPMLVGSYVSWEWNMGSVWEQRWYSDPLDNDELKTGWSSAAEFVGRDLNALP